MSDLSSIDGLLTQISTFKTKVLENSGNTPESVLSECVRACITSTYYYIFSNCNELHAREFGEDPKVTFY